MVDQEIQIVQHTWLDVAKKEEPHFAELFYTKLFEQSPQFKSIIEQDANFNSKQLISILDYLIEKLDKSCFIEEARTLGKKCAAYGIRNEDYDLIKQAFFLALKTKLKEKWTPTVMVSWIWFYSTISYLMKDASRENRA